VNSSSNNISSISESDVIAQLRKKLEETEGRLQYAELKIRVLEERLRLVRIAKYAPGSKNLSDAQLELLELEPGVSRDEVQAESQREPIPRIARKPRKHPGRQELPSDLQRVERIVPCTPDQRMCEGCGKETIIIGYEESSQLDVEPAKYFVLVTKREKRVCRHCEEGGVVTAPLPVRIIEKSLASDRLVIDTIVGKYCDHSPLYRPTTLEVLRKRI
jgi:transposase